MKIEIADELVKKSGMSVEEIMLRVAILLFQEEKLTLGQAADLANLHQIQFQQELAKRNIPIHYGEEEFESDLKNLQINFG
jgi:predicted HTH domain antitoxin